MKTDLEENIEIPEGVTIAVDDNVYSFKGPKGENSRKFYNPRLGITLEGNNLILRANAATKREKKLIYTMAAHIRNLIWGVMETHEYKLKICSGHFPMNVAINNNVLTIKNFLGEAVPRTLKIKEGSDVKVDGQIITVVSTDIEKAGQTAASIEQLTRITNRDRRIFQDGIFIIEKSKRTRA